jgi:hypothetical protein
MSAAGGCWQFAGPLPPPRSAIEIMASGFFIGGLATLPLKNGQTLCLPLVLSDSIQTGSGLGCKVFPGHVSTS